MTIDTLQNKHKRITLKEKLVGDPSPPPNNKSYLLTAKLCRVWLSLGFET